MRRSETNDHASGPATRLARARRAFQRLGPSGFVRLCAYNVGLLVTGRATRHNYVYDDAWDREHGVDTAGTVEVSDIAGPQVLKLDAVRYEPTPPECFAFLLQAAEIPNPGDYTFVDLGSGKGRVPLLAALSGFRESVGVEFGSDLHVAALENQGRMKGRASIGETLFLQGDARAHRWEDSPTVCFLNNPFSADILDVVLDNIEDSLAHAPRDFRIIYYHSNHMGCIDRRPDWVAIARGWWRDSSHHYAIYRWQQATVPDQ